MPRSSRALLGVLIAAILSAAMASAASADVVHRFKFDNSLSDYMGGSAASALSGTASYAASGGVGGQGLSFDGSTDVLLGNTLTPTDSVGTGDFSISASFRTTQTTGRVAIFSNRDDGCNYGGGWLDVFLGGGALVGNLSGANPNPLFAAHPPFVADGALHRVTLARSGTTATLWLDGAEVVSVTAPGIAGNVRNGNGLQLGFLDAGCSGTRFKGTIDDVRVSDSAAYAQTDSMPEFFATFPGESNALDVTTGENGTWSGTAGYAAGHSGQAMSFDGTNSVSIPQPAGNFGTDDGTVSFWLRSTQAEKSNLVESRDSCDNADGWDIRLNRPGYANTVSIETWGSSGYQTTGGTTPINDGTWHKITVSRVSGLLSLGIDGIREGVEASVDSTLSTTAPVQLGVGPCTGISPSFRLVGLLDDVQLIRGAGAPLTTSAASVTGTPQAGQTLTAHAAFSGTSPHVTYAWQRCDVTGTTCGAVVGVSSTYTLGQDDVGSRMKLTATAANDAGSESTSALTSTVTPPAPGVTTGAASGVSTTGATLNGTVNPEGAATTYRFEYGTSTAYGSQAPASDASAGSDSTDHAVSQDVSGLAPNTTYHFRVVATNAGGTSAGADQVFTTNPLAPGATTGTASGITASGAMLNGTIDSKGVAGATYHFDYGPTAAYGASTASQTAGGTTTQDVSAALNGLSPDTTYHFRVVVTDVAGTTSGGDQTFTTAGAPVITGLSPDHRCVRSATLHAPSEGAGGLSFSFTLSQGATVRYEILRRNDSPHWRSCPAAGGTSPVTFSSVWSASAQQDAGAHDTAVASAVKRLPRGHLRLRAGHRRLGISRLVSGQKLRWGSYLLRISATDAQGLPSRPAVVQFWVLKDWKTSARTARR